MAYIFSNFTSNVFSNARQQNLDIPKPISQPINPSKNKGILVIMKGTVGAGKSTFSAKIKEQIEQLGGYCVVEGTDKYCKTGISMPEAQMMVTKELLKAQGVDNKLLVVIIDTCGTSNYRDIIFDVNFAGWKKVNYWPNFERSHLKEYFAWTLCNVLKRQKPTEDDTYWLNGEDCSVSHCIDVHRRKAVPLWGKKIPKVFSETPSSKESAMEELRKLVESYEEYLKTRPIDVEVNKFVNEKVV